MKFLKSLALSLLSFLLFLSLSVFGLAFMLNSTVLNPSFVTSEINKLDMGAMAQELTTRPTPDTYSNPALETAQVNAISAIEPEVKEQLGVAINSIYDYLLGKSQDIDLAQIVRNSLLSSDFALTVVDKVEIAPFTDKFLNRQLSRAGFSSYMIDYIVKSLDKIIADNKPWLKQQLALAADPILDYLAGKRESFSISISLQPIIGSLRDTMRQEFLQSPPPELASLSQAELEQYFEQFSQELPARIPSTLNLTQDLVERYKPTSPEALNESERVLSEVKVYVGWFQLYYKVLLGFMLLLIALIVVINRKVKSTTRDLGTTFLTYGAFEYAGIFIAKYFYKSQMPQIMTPDIPPSLQTWILQLSNDFLAPLAMFSLGMLIGGAILIVVSFVYKPRQTQS